MLILKKLNKITGHIFFVIIFILFSTSHSNALDKFQKADKISDYFSGILLLNKNKYSESYNFLKKLDGLEKSHFAYSSKYLYSLVNSGNITQAFYFVKKLEKEKQDSFESDLIKGIYYLNNSKLELSYKYFVNAKQRNSGSALENYIANSLMVWSNLNNYELSEASRLLDGLDNRFENLKKIQNVFLNCYFNSKETDELFSNLTQNDKTNFSRYNYFYAKYLKSINNEVRALNVIKNSLEKYPRNLLINQYKIDLEKNENNFEFDCKKIQHIIAEILYITANALSSQSIYYLSNFYLNLSKYLNKDFHAFDTLMAENFYNIDDFLSAKKIFKRLTNYGSAFKWYANKQIAKILIQEENKSKSLQLLSASYNEIKNQGIYHTFDYAEFLKNNEEFNEAIIYYSKILNNIDKKHPLFPEATDGRGVAYERIGKWEKAEKDLLDSLEASPDQAYVINYLAYSWIEQGIKIQKSLEMLEKANKLKSNDPFIIDSLGWALFKLKKYEESKKYLQQAVSIMPADPIVNDHFGDVLWKNGNKIQARYYWEYVLNLEKAEEDLKKKIEVKLLKGLE